MTGTQTLVARTALGATFACVGYLLSSSRRLLSLEKFRFDRFAIGAFALSRLGLYALIFLILRIAPRGDIPSYYVPEGEQAMLHKLIYRDFDSSYAPLHPYLDGAFLHLWHSALMIILLAIVAEILTYPLWLRIGRAFLPETTVRTAALLYLASPISLQFVTVDGQNNILISALIALSIWMILKHREAFAGALVGIAIASVKFLPLIFVPAFFFSVPRRWRFTAAFAAVIAVVYGGVTLLHGNILDPLTREGGIKSAGDLWFVIEAFTGLDLPNRLLDLIAVLVLCFVLARAARVALRSPGQFVLTVLNASMASLTMALLLFSKKSWPSYLMLALFPLCLIVSSEYPAKNKLRILCFNLFGCIAVVEHSVWASTFSAGDATWFHTALLQHQPGAIAFLVLELCLIGGYLWLFLESVRRIAPESTLKAAQLEELTATA